MGKGDRKSRKGKIFMGTYGNTRPRKSSTESTTILKKKTEPKKEKLIKPLASKKKANAKKVTAKKVTAKKVTAKKK